MTTTIEILERAYEKGSNHSDAQYDEGKVAPDSDIWIDVDPQDLLFALTGEKIDPESLDGQEILTEYQDGYYDTWEDKIDG